MYIPMETLSLTTARTDSGAGARSKSGSGIENAGSNFEKAFGKELAKHESHLTNKKPNPHDAREHVKSVKESNKINKSKIEDNTEEALAAGAMQSGQNGDVFILEGDNESTTTPQVHVEIGTEPPELNQMVTEENENANMIPNTQTESKAETFSETVTNERQAYAQAAEAANMDRANAKLTAENTDTLSTARLGEVPARMSEIRTQDSHTNAESSSGFMKNGNLSPLENENDEVRADRQNSYSEVVQAVRGAVEEESETEAQKAAQAAAGEVLQAPPLSEGIKPEQFAAAQKMTQAALAAPVKPENLFTEMIQRVEMMQSDTKSTMTIQLNPEFLGRVALEVAVDAAGLHVKINAEDSGIRSMINGHLTTLIEALEHKGIEVVEVEVAYTGTNLGTHQDSREGASRQGGRQNTSQSEANTAEQIAFYAALPDLMEYYLDTGVSSVEYSA